MDYPKAKARDRATLEQQIMDPCIAKNDAEWWAMTEIERLRAALERIDYYYVLNDGDDMDAAEAIEIDVKTMREIHVALQPKKGEKK